MTILNQRDCKHTKLHGTRGKSGQGIEEILVCSWKSGWITMSHDPAQSVQGRYTSTSTIRSQTPAVLNLQQLVS